MVTSFTRGAHGTRDLSKIAGLRHFGRAVPIRLDCSTITHTNANNNGGTTQGLEPRSPG